MAAIGTVLLATLLPSSDGHAAARFHPFGDIHDLLTTGDVCTILMQVGGNVALFVPVALLAPLATQALDTVSRTTFAVAGLSTAVEAAQYLLPIGRTASIDDVLLNTVGGVAGYLMLRALSRPWKWSVALRWTRCTSRRTTKRIQKGCTSGDWRVG